MNLATHLMNIVPLHFFKDVPRGDLWFVRLKCLIRVFVFASKCQRKCAQQWPWRGPCQLWIVCNPAKKTTNVCPVTTTSAPNFNQKLCLVMLIESSYIKHLFECEGKSYNSQHQTHRITHANHLLSMRASRCKRARPKSTSWCGRPGASLSARQGLTEVGNRIRQLFPNCRAVATVFREIPSFEHEKSTRGMPDFVAQTRNP